MKDFHSDHLRQLLKEIYQDQSAEDIELLLSQLMQISEENSTLSRKNDSNYHLWDSSSVVLITYPDSIYSSDKPSLNILYDLIISYIGNLSSIVHILPFLYSTSDGGFAVSSHTTIDKSFGDWEDLKKISKKRKLMGDIVLNHISSRHQWVEDFVKDKEPGSKYILSPSKKDNWENVFRPRNTSLFKTIQTIHGPRDVWTTFGPDQIDVNWAEPNLLLEYLKLIALYIENGISWLRLDAVGFIWKRSGGRCINDKKAHKIIKIIRIMLNNLLKDGVLVTETNVPEKDNLSYLITADEANIAYNFPLPPLILEAIISQKTDLLNKWLKAWKRLPRNTALLNFTSCHDGVGLIPLKGLMSDVRIKNLLSECEKRGGLISHRTLPEGEEEPYELNISWWSAMKSKSNERNSLQTDRFILSQLFVMALPGIPAFYLQALLACENDLETFKKTGQRRDINRKKFDAYDLFNNLNNPKSFASKNLKFLQFAMKTRSQLKAFHPSSQMRHISVSCSGIVAICRGEREDRVWVIHNFTSKLYRFSLEELGIRVNHNDNIEWKDYLSEKIINASNVEINPYSVVWIRRNEVYK